VSLFGDIGNALKNVVLMQSHLERLERIAERQDADIAGLRDVMARMSERLVRVETIIDEGLATARSRHRLPKE
jgi:hypothetical protein